MRSILSPAALVVALSLPLFLSTMATAQIFTPTNFQLVDESEFLSGCAPPSPCDCLVLNIGDVEGTFGLTPLLPPFLPILEYTVENVDWTLNPAIDPVPSTITGSGLYFIDVINDTHSMALDLEIDGAPRTFTSGGYVPIDEGLPAESLGIYIYEMIDSCLYEGFQINAVIAADEPSFLRGDCNTDSIYNIGDPIDMLDKLFGLLTVLPPCADACDANDDGLFDVADPVYALNNQFSGGSNPPPPFPLCGVDPTSDSLDCDIHPVCTSGPLP